MSKTKEKKVEELTNTIQTKFPELLLKFEVIDRWLTIKPMAFLGTEPFDNLLAQVRELGGEYVSAGPHSHLRIPLSKEQSLQQWYDRQEMTLPPPVININIEAKPEQLEKILKILREEVIP